MFILLFLNNEPVPKGRESIVKIAVRTCKQIFSKIDVVKTLFWMSFFKQKIKIKESHFAIQ